MKGEISNFVQAASGHIYFNLKLESCVIACAFFRHLQTAGSGDLDDGLQVVAMGSVTLYEPRSQYQFGIKKIIPIGDGISSLKLKRLRDKLEAEGLFSQRSCTMQIPRGVRYLSGTLAICSLKEATYLMKKIS